MYEPEFYNEAWHKARKAHRCCECKETIVKDEQYHRFSGKWDNEVRSYKSCGRCYEVRAWALGNDSDCAIYCYLSGLYEYLIEAGNETFDFSSCPAELPEIMYKYADYS